MMESKKCLEEAKKFEQVFKNIFKSDIGDLVQSAQDIVDDKESNQRFDNGTLKQNQSTELAGCQKCTICDFKSKKKNYLKSHIRLLHGPDVVPSNVLVCYSCEFETTRQLFLRTHIRSQHFNEKRLSCNMCDFKSFYKQNVKSHIMSNHKNSNTARPQNLEYAIAKGLSDISHSTYLQVAKCKVCKFETKKMSFLKRHANLMHGPNADVSNVLTCTNCEFETDNIQFLENHINAKHLNEKNFSCNTCDFKSYYRQHVKNHIRSKHKGSKQTKVTKIYCLDCISNTSHSTCTQAQKRPSKQKKNKKEVVNKEKDRMCLECSYVTQKSSYLRRHLQLSHGQDSEHSKIITCKSCEFESSNPQSVARHRKSIHLNQKRFNCSQCDFKSYLRINVKSHMATNHADNEVEVERINCSQSCTEHHQCFKDNSESEKHNFECNYCNLKLTTSQGAIVSHMKAFHPEEKLFHCNNCSYRCNWLYNLKIHKTTEHKRVGTKDNSLEATFSGIIGLFMRHTETKIGDSS